MPIWGLEAIFLGHSVSNYFVPKKWRKLLQHLLGHNSEQWLDIFFTIKRCPKITFFAFYSVEFYIYLSFRSNSHCILAILVFLLHEKNEVERVCPNAIISGCTKGVRCLFLWFRKILWHLRENFQIFIECTHLRAYSLKTFDLRDACGRYWKNFPLTNFSYFYGTEILAKTFRTFTELNDA